jgi:hypothetical protein
MSLGKAFGWVLAIAGKVGTLAFQANSNTSAFLSQRPIVDLLTPVLLAASALLKPWRNTKLIA